MKKIEYKEVPATRLAQTVDILCNKCGASLNQSNLSDAYEGCVEETYSFGFHSKHFGDGTSITFSLCEQCLFNLVETFVIPPQKTETAGY